MVRAVCTNVY